MKCLLKTCACLKEFENHTLSGDLSDWFDCIFELYRKYTVLLNLCVCVCVCVCVRVCVCVCVRVCVCVCVCV